MGANATMTEERRWMVRTEDGRIVGYVTRCVAHDDPHCWHALTLSGNVIGRGRMTPLPTRCSVCGRRILTDRTTGKCWRHR